MKFQHLFVTAITAVLLSVSLPISAGEFCTSDDIAKMRAAKHSEAEMSRICYAKALKHTSSVQSDTVQPTSSVRPDTVQPTASVPLMDIADLKVDIASLDGRKVRVQGVGQYIMDVFFLKKNVNDMNPIFVDISKLQRNQRRQIIQQCADIMAPCSVMIQGTVGKVNYQNGIVAENVGL